MQVGVRRAAGSWRWPRGPAVQAVSWQTRQAAAGEFGFVADLAGYLKAPICRAGVVDQADEGSSLGLARNWLLAQMERLGFWCWLPACSVRCQGRRL
jgi:hypothetical protein